MLWFWLAIISAMFSAAAAILQKKVLKDIPALSFTLIVSLFIAVFSTPLLLFTEIDKLSTGSVSYLFIKSVINAIAFLCIMTALKNLELSRTLPVLASSPLLIALLAYIFLGEELKSIEFTGMFLIVTGTYILEIKKGESPFYPFTVFKNSRNHLIIILALILMTITSVMDKFILVKYKLPPVLFVVFQNYFFLIVFVVIYLFSKRKSEVNKLFAENKNLIFLIVIISLVTIGYRLTQIEAVKLAPVGLVISLKRLSVLFAVIIGAKIFKEEDYKKKVIATVLIVGGAMLIFKD